MAPPLRYADLEVVLGTKRQLLGSVRSAAESATWQSHMREFFRSLERVTLKERSAVLTLLVVTADELRHIVHGGQEYKAVLEEALASSDVPIQRVLGHVEAALATMINQGFRQAPTSDCVDTVVKVIEQRYAEPLTLEVLARLVCRERSHVASQFRRETGFTIHRYLTRVRIWHASELLRRGEKVEAVMLLVGYHSKKSFYSQFRAQMGQTPGTYRMRGNEVRGVRAAVSTLVASSDAALPRLPLPASVGSDSG